MIRYMSPCALPLIVLALSLAGGACGGSSASEPLAPGGAAGFPQDASADAARDAFGLEVGPKADDGTPTRKPCTNSFGTGLSTNFGRLDGYLVAVVDPSKHGCSGDQDHVHLQVSANGAVYDVAVNVADQNSSTAGVLLAAVDSPLPNEPWTEGWHSGTIHLDYVADLHLHNTGFMQMTTPVLAQKIETELQNANHISVYATGYGPGGAHLVHRNHGGTDGAIVINPLSSTPRVLAMHFADQFF